MFRFVPSVESLDDRLNLSPVVAAAVPEPAAEVRHRFLAHMDRTPTATPGGGDSVWIDLGTPAATSDSHYGQGILKSQDAGKTWTL